MNKIKENNVIKRKLTEQRNKYSKKLKLKKEININYNGKFDMYKKL